MSANVNIQFHILCYISHLGILWFLILSVEDIQYATALQSHFGLSQCANGLSWMVLKYVQNFVHTWAVFMVQGCVAHLGEIKISWSN